MGNQFPKGYNTGLDWGDWQEGATLWTPDPEENSLTKKCTCGIWVTMGKDADLIFHSEWCELKLNK